MPPKNNLRSQLNWLKSSQANVPKPSKLCDITNIERGSRAENEAIDGNNDPASARTPFNKQAGDMAALMNNVERSARSSGLRVARKETSSFSSTNNSRSSPQPTFQQPTTSGIVANGNGIPRTPAARAATTPAVIDLTFDDDPESTPSASKRKQPAASATSTTKKQKKTTSTKNDINKNDNNNDNNNNEDNDNNDNESDLTALENYDFSRRQAKTNPENLSSATTTISSISTSTTITNTSIPEIIKSSSIIERLTRLQKSYIDICEKRISLLVKRVSIEESLELSEKDKRIKRSDLTKQLSQLELKQESLKAQLDKLEQQSEEQVAHHHPQVSPSIIQRPTIAELPHPTPTYEAPNLISSNIQVAGTYRTTQTNRTVPQTSFINNMNDKDEEEEDLEAEPTSTIASHRRITNQSVQRTHQQNTIDSDDEGAEEDVGIHTMDGLVTSEPEDHDTDLDGFIVGQDQISNSDDEYYHSASEALVEDDLNGRNIRVSQSEIDNLRNLSQEEEEVEDGNEINEMDDNDSSEIDEIQNDTYRATIRSEELGDDFNFDEDDIIENIDEKFDEEREVDTQAVEIVDLDDSDLDFDDLPPPRSNNRTIEHEMLPSSPIAQQPDDDLDDILGQLPLPIGEKHPWTSEVWGKLREVFKLTSFRPNQLEAVNASLSGRDVFVLMPTGGGKSLCYQLPAIIKSGKTHGTTIVVSPLISLMQDQVEHLWEKDIPAGMISSKSPLEERKNTFHLFVTGQLKLIYLSPEMIGASTQAQNAINKLYRDGNLARIVIDEAHCVSSWGHDFRPDYTSLSFFKKTYPDIPMMALTATANEHVRMDIVHSLKLNNPLELKQSFNRINLYYEVLPKDKNHFKHLEESIRGKFKNQTGIIYCHSKNLCEQTADKLSNQGIRTAFYHAGMSPEDRLTVQKQWQSGEIKVICATIAFGMGIDKPDVRFVIHLTLPRTLEGYYQETGRAGRDGKYSHCTMYYTFKDAKNLQTMISKDKELDKAGKEKHMNKLIQVMQYCENNTDCRRKQVLQYFNEEFDKKDCHKNCDNCRKGVTSELIEKDVTDYAKKLTQLVKSIQDDKVTLIHCQDVFKGLRYGKIQQSGHDGSEFHGSGKDLDKRDIERIAFHLITEKVLEEYSVLNGAGFTTSYVRGGRNAHLLLTDRKKIIMSFSTNTRSTNKTGSRATTTNITNDKSRSTSKIINHEQLNEFRLSSTPKIVSAKVHYERTSSNLGESFTEQQQMNGSASNKRFAPKPIQLNEMRFNTEDDRINFAKAFRELTDRRSKVMADLGFKNSSSVMTDVSLRDLAFKLPTTEDGFNSINGLSYQQKMNFKLFRDLLTKLKRDQSSPNNSASATKSKYFTNKEREDGQSVIAQIRASQEVSQSQSQSSRGRKGGHRKYKNSGRVYKKKVSSQKPSTTKKKRTQSAMPI